MAADYAPVEDTVGASPQRNLQTTFGFACYQLTDRDFPHYISPMDAELRGLEERVGQLVELTHHLRSENRELRQQLAQAASDNKRLTEKVEAAKARLESLLSHLPEEH